MCRRQCPARWPCASGRSLFHDKFSVWCLRAFDLRRQIKIDSGRSPLTIGIVVGWALVRKLLIIPPALFLTAHAVGAYGSWH